MGLDFNDHVWRFAFGKFDSRRTNDIRNFDTDCWKNARWRASSHSCTDTSTDYEYIDKAFRCKPLPFLRGSAWIERISSHEIFITPVLKSISSLDLSTRYGFELLTT